jgi:hypothetical protein
VAQVGRSSVIAAEGPGQSLEFYWQATGTVPWHPEQVAGPGTTFSAPSVALVGESSVISAEGPNLAVEFYWQAIGAVPWHAEQVSP